MPASPIVSAYVHQCIEGCGECPYGDYEYYKCRHPQKADDFDFTEERRYDSIPERCPLRTASVIIHAWE